VTSAVPLPNKTEARNSVNIRRASSDDVSGIFRVRTSVRENHLSEEELSDLGITRDSVAGLLRSGEARAWCAEVDGAIVGFSMARQPERDIFALFVLPQFEGRGIGSLLLDAAVDWLRTSDPKPIRLNTERTTRAFRFYTNRGWRETGSFEDGDPILEFSN
jgi:ribosomal protein S18 acetylase RimI-like enzyme